MTPDALHSRTPRSSKAVVVTEPIRVVALVEVRARVVRVGRTSLSVLAN